MAGFSPGVRITRDLIAANPDAALEHLQMLIEASQKSDVVIQGMQQQIGEAKGSREAMDRLTEEHAAALRAAADKDTQISALQGEIADSNAQRTSLITGNGEALAAYRDLVLKAEPTPAAGAYLRWDSQRDQCLGGGGAGRRGARAEQHRREQRQIEDSGRRSAAHDCPRPGDDDAHGEDPLRGAPVAR